MYKGFRSGNSGPELIADEEEQTGDSENGDVVAHTILLIADRRNETEPPTSAPADRQGIVVLIPVAVSDPGGELDSHRPV